MLTISYYFLQVLLCSALLMGYYWLVLRNKRFHQYNRFYLLAVVLLSWIVPLIKIEWGYIPAGSDTRMLQLLSVVADNNTYIEQTISHNGFALNRSFVVAGLYTAVSAAMLFALVLAFARIHTLLKEHSCRTVGDIYLVLTHAKGTPFSFFRYIFWNEEIDLRSESGKQILQHELTHVEQKHSIDKLFIQCMLVFGWFNPFFWLLKKEMEMIHEFIADNKAVKEGDTAALAQMLLTAAYPGQHFSLANPFFFSPVKRRLQMLANTRHPRFSYLRRLVVMPLLALLVILFAFRNKEKNEPVTISVEALMQKVAAQTTLQVNLSKPLLHVYPVLKDTLLPLKDSSAAPGKKQVAPAAIALKLLAPEEQAGSLQDAMILVDGKRIDHALLDILDPAKIASVDVYKGEKAKALYSDDGKNGVVVITTKKQPAAQVEIKEHVTGEMLVQEGVFIERGTEKKNSPDTTIRISNTQNKSIPSDMLVIIDGVKGGNLNALQPEQIASVNVLKNEAATSLYGEEGKHGVVLIATTKNSFKPVTGVRIVPHASATSVEGKLIFTKTQEAPSFPGGPTAWQQYLQRNLNEQLPAEKGAAPGTYTVWVSFLVDAEGNLHDIKADNDPGYGTAAEAVRVLARSPQWKPAEQNGQKVMTKIKQSVSWQVLSPNDRNRPVSPPKAYNPQAVKQLAATMQKNAEERLMRLSALRKEAEQKLQFSVKLRSMLAHNQHTFFDVDGKSGVADNGGSYAFLNSTTNIVFVDGKRMTPSELNARYLRSGFRFMAADETTATIRKYGKGVLVVSSKPLNQAELKKTILQ